MVVVRNQSLVCQIDQAIKSVQNYNELRRTRVDFGTARTGERCMALCGG
jgi:hypothetical protein